MVENLFPSMNDMSFKNCILCWLGFKFCFEDIKQIRVINTMQNRNKIRKGGNTFPQHCSSDWACGRVWALPSVCVSGSDLFLQRLYWCLYYRGIQWWTDAETGCCWEMWLTAVSSSPHCSYWECWKHSVYGSSAHNLKGEVAITNKRTMNNNKELWML